MFCCGVVAKLLLCQPLEESYKNNKKRIAFVINSCWISHSLSQTLLFFLFKFGLVLRAAQQLKSVQKKVDFCQSTIV